MEQNKQLQDHLANERTYLAWIRTAFAVMAFGFVVVKFSLFLTQISVFLKHTDIQEHKEYSAIAGNIIVGAGIATILMGYLRYRSAEKRVRGETAEQSNLSIHLLTAFLLLVSTCLIVFLIVRI